MKKILSVCCFVLVCGFMSAQSYNIIPQPVEILPAEGVYKLSGATTIVADKHARATADYLQKRLAASTGIMPRIVTTSGVASIVLKVNPSLSFPAEGYHLSVAAGGVVIEGKDEAGLFYGVQTLLQLMPAKVYATQLQTGVEWNIPGVTVKDYPRFPYRGMMLDVVRQFFDFATVKKYIDWLSMHKINKFHWHLTDDQGWRIEIKKYPKLTTVGAWRGPGEALSPSYGSGDKRYGGFYTQQQIKEMVKYAAERHVEIIPEIDLPGHSRAVAAAYPGIACPTDKEDLSQSAQGEKRNTWCVGNEHNYAMLSDILKEIAVLFPSKMIHIGGDEVNMSVWQHCPLCSAKMKKDGMKSPSELQNYFVHRLGDIVHHLGKQMAGWDEILDGGNLDPATQVYAWRSLKKVQEAADKGVSVVVMAGQHLYFDMAQSKYDRGHNWAGLVPLETVYDLDPADPSMVSTGQSKYVRGVQAGLWTELLNEPARFLEYQSYPRICALAELGWTPQAQRNWADFYHRMTTSHFDRLYNMGVAFRVPPPAAHYKNGMIRVMLPYANAQVRYNADGTDPGVESPLYKAPIAAFDYTKYKFRTFYKDMPSIVMSVETEFPGTWQADTAAKPRVQSWDLTGIVDRPGIWYAGFVPAAGVKGVAAVSQVRLFENGFVVASDERTSSTDKVQRYRLPLFAFDKTKKYTLKALVQGQGTISGIVDFQRTVYQEPPVGISVDMNLNNENARLLTDYNFDTAIRTVDSGKAGQSLTFVFDVPVTCATITSVTGLPFTGIYPLKSGHLEVSYDGFVWEKGSVFVKGTSIMHPGRPVKGVRIVVDGPNDDPMIVFQDLRIE